jgi:hypothetical protein
MTQIMNFKRMEVSGATKEEALAKAPFDIMGDATQAYKIWRKKQEKGVTDSDKKQFMLDYLAKKSKNCAGVGFSITLESAIADTRERPYAIHDVRNEKGTRHYKTVYQIIDRATGSVLAETSETKAKAKELAKALYTEKGFKGNLICTYTKQVVDGEPTAFTVEYAPSKSSRIGNYLVFGVERG